MLGTQYGPENFWTKFHIRSFECLDTFIWFSGPENLKKTCFISSSNFIFFPNCTRVQSFYPFYTYIWLFT